MSASAGLSFLLTKSVITYITRQTGFVIEYRPLKKWSCPLTEGIALEIASETVFSIKSFSRFSSQSRILSPWKDMSIFPICTAMPSAEHTGMPLVAIMRRENPVVVPDMVTSTSPPVDGC